MTRKDYYNILNVTIHASASEIRRSYRRLALAYHPDHHPDDPEAEEKFKEISEAYSVLGNAEERRKYDLRSEARRGRRDVFEQSDPESMFWQFLEREGYDVRKAWCLGGGRRGCGRGNSWFHMNTAPARDGLTLLQEMLLTPAEAAQGVRKQIVVAADGNPRIYTFKIPGGVASGREFRLILDRSKQLSVFLRIRIDENGENGGAGGQTRFPSFNG